AGAAFPREDPRRKAVYEDGLHFDSPLSELGLASCQNFRAEGSAPQVELVACSPLTRAVQTASEIFGFGPASGSDRIVTGTSVPGPLVVLEVLREFNSSVFHPSDARRRRDELEKTFPYANFSGVTQGIDMLLGPGIVETAEIADSRIHWLLAWLRMRPERSIACVSHGAFLRRLLAERLTPAGWRGEPRLGNMESIVVPIAFLD
ncbi:unnamed protein product, partial [Polarella glacialis]